MNRVKPTEQIYTNYTAEDFMVWEILFSRQMASLAQYASRDYLNAVETIGFRKDQIPEFKDLNKRLAALTGWKIITVPGICPPAEFFRLLSEKTFTCTCWLRTMEELDYLEEPDMFHDVFGHVPLLTNPEYCEFFEALGTIAMENIDNQEAIDMLERLYWFTIEFGLMRQDEELKIYGSGIISSTGETKHAIGNRSAKHQFNVSQIMEHPFRTDVMQDDYYVIDNFQQLVDSLPLVRQKLEQISDEEEARA
jgi:phenylalanine-4-hydroxylase